jgi:hypothetical protein
MTEAVPDATLEASLPDFFGVTFSLGAGYELSHNLRIAGGLSHIVSPARDSESRYASYELPSRLPDSSGHYTQAITYANLNVALSF